MQKTAVPIIVVVDILVYISFLLCDKIYKDTSKRLKHGIG